MASNGCPPKRNFVCPPLAQVLQTAKAKSAEQRKDYLSWDDYYMAVALLSAKRSKDPNSQVGACIVDNGNRIVGIGYESFPHKVKDDEFPWTKIRENDNTTTDPTSDPINDRSFYIIHAEANAILKKKTASLKGSRIYTTQFPCNECAKLIVQSEISEVIYISDKHSDKPSFRASKLLLDAASIKYTRFIPLTSVIKIDFTELIEEELSERLAADVDFKSNSRAPSTSSEQRSRRLSGEADAKRDSRAAALEADSTHTMPFSQRLMMDAESRKVPRPPSASADPANNLPFSQRLQEEIESRRASTSHEPNNKTTEQKPK